MRDWIQILTIGTNLSIIILCIKVIRHISKLEFKVELMWMVFEKQHIHILEEVKRGIRENK